MQLNGEVSESFNLTVGVKQGGVISGIFFCVYMGAVIEKVHEEFKKVNLSGINIIYSSREQNLDGANRSNSKRCTKNMNIYEILFNDWLMMAESMSDLTLMMNIALKIIRKS